MKNKLILITGASRGIGKAIACNLGKDGNTIVGTGTSENSVKLIDEEFNSLNIDGKGMLLSNNIDDSVFNLYSEIENEYNRSPEILINNAGITNDNLLMRMTDEQWLETIDVNINLIFKVTREFIKPMIKNKYGRIVCISSVVGSTGNPGQTNYVATKSAIIGFCKSLAKEVASRGITVNSVSPGFIETDMTNKLTDNQKEQILSNIPMSKLGSVDDIANAVNFLISDNASYITGENLHVNGGLYMP
tara:strand:+ start:771 stop:1511 length:741 start_codon:yes stop_codon:yes gene_type:complete